MNLTQRVPPSGLPITPSEILAHLRITDSNPPDLADILRIAEGCVLEVQNRLRRALAPQSWSLWLDAFCARITLPLPPLIEVEAIKYLDADMQWQTLDPSHYRVIHGGEDRGSIVLIPDQAWPATAYVPACVEVQFTCGYPEIGSPAQRTLPADICNGILELIAFRYVVRDGTAFASDRILDELPAMKALQRYKVY